MKNELEILEQIEKEIWLKFDKIRLTAFWEASKQVADLRLRYWCDR